jgi:hypothetical protein
VLEPGVYFLIFFQICHIEYLAHFFPKNRKFIRICIRKIKVSKNVGKKNTGWKLEFFQIFQIFLSFFVELDIVVSRAFSLFRKYLGPKKKILNEAQVSKNLKFF